MVEKDEITGQCWQKIGLQSLVFFLDDTQLTCSMDLNSQNTRFWYYENCNVIHGVLFSGLKGQ